MLSNSNSPILNSRDLHMQLIKMDTLAIRTGNKQISAKVNKILQSEDFEELIQNPVDGLRSAINKKVLKCKNELDGFTQAA